ncbi:lasso peptide biosynthesis B2 protein [Haloarcula sp. CBA1130]|uniref:lasso peptide biosynthesis B2 protein n=1 Tax=unclassified Haloarcula TaxID=2624677 RepID=UPI0012489DB8|nr:MULTISPECIES: lasso peptide biosynthesis B2 protein [unclassified Haloarcula]KAA9397180.1 lasso peptide biosynthesis B2 protein [Haloarcula sp. CBA1129]KAA9402783.1 lasso peptide biosynthesis B2 protein [Haloarcula sp. CBA1130]
MRARLREFRALSRAQKLLLCEAVVLMATSKVLLAVAGLEDAERYVGTISQALPCHRQSGSPESVRWAVLTAGSRLPGTYDCLDRALAGSTLLVANDLPHCLRFGVDTQSDTFEAHAWIESNGDVLIGDVADFERFRTLTEREERG